jgi:hypothetical protein
MNEFDQNTPMTVDDPYQNYANNYGNYGISGNVEGAGNSGSFVIITGIWFLVPITICMIGCSINCDVMSFMRVFPRIEALFTV